MVAIEETLNLTGDSLSLKIIANALRGYQKKHVELDSNKLNDFIFEIEKVYQSHHSLQENEWGATKEHIEENPFLA